MFDGRYCVEAIALFLRELAYINSPAQQYHAYVVGGADMFGISSGQPLIGERNVEVVRVCLKDAGFNVRAEHVLGNKYRKVELDMNTGAVLVDVEQKRIRL